MNTKEIFDILPLLIKNEMENIRQLNKLQEVRIKVNKPLIFQVGSQEIITSYNPSFEDVKFVLQKISNYSIYAFEEEIKQGYITIRGGHRVGLCGSCVIQNEGIKTIKDIASLNIRVCREVIDCSTKVMPYIIKGGTIRNTIIISPPKCGKTTLLRDITRHISDGMKNNDFIGKKVCVIDERSELGGCYNGIPQMDLGFRTDILDNCPKSQGIMLAIRSMSPDVIVCDEIGAKKDMESLLMALNCGVSIITTIHGNDVDDLYKRVVFKEIVENKVFSIAIVLSGLNGVGTLEEVYDFDKSESLWRR